MPDTEALARAIPKPVTQICRRLASGGHKGWLVGGAVRDILMSRRVGRCCEIRHDWDIATSARPEDVQRLFRRVIPTGIKHGTVTVLLDGEGFELTTLRGEGAYSDGRRPDSVTFVDDIEADLARRDFTINAIAYDPLDDRVVDPFGGTLDLERSLLRAVGNPNERFAEDGLRVLRAARFVATLEAELEPETEAAIRPSLASYAKVSQERIREEWCKALMAKEPSRAFRVMQRHGLLAISAPELDSTAGCEQNRFHAYDVWEHTLRCLDGCLPKLELRLAALLHDIGKPVTREFQEEKQDFSFHGHEQAGARLAREVLTRLRFSNEERDRVVALVRHHLVVYEPAWTDSAVRRWLQRVTPDLVDDLLELCVADVQAKGRDARAEVDSVAQLRERVNDVLAKGAAMQIRDLAVSGNDLMSELGLEPGPQLGALLRALLEVVTDQPEVNQRDVLLVRARELALQRPQGQST